MSTRLKNIENKETIRIDRITKKAIVDMDFGTIIELYNAPLDLFITIEKLYEIKNYGNRKVIYDLKKYIVRDRGVKDHSIYSFNEIILDDADTVKKYVASLHESRRSREVLYIKLLMNKNICIGDVVKLTSYGREGYYKVLPFYETNADKIFINCQKLDKKNKLTDKIIRCKIDNIRKMKSIKIRK